MMKTLERECWLGYQAQLPNTYTLYHERIDHILNDPDMAKETFKIMTLNDLLRVVGL